MLTCKKSKLFSSNGVASYAKKIKPLLQNLKNLNTKNRETPATQVDVKGVLKCVVGPDEETNALIDEAMEVGAALFLTAAHLSVARTLFRNPNQYASAIDATAQWASDFKKKPHMRTLKTAFEKQCCSKSSSSAIATCVKPQRKRLLEELSSSEDSDSSDSSTSSSSRSGQSENSDTSDSQLRPKPAKSAKITKKLVPKEEEDDNDDNQEEDEAQHFAEKEHEKFLEKAGRKNKKSREQPKPKKKQKGEKEEKEEQKMVHLFYSSRHLLCYSLIFIK